MEDQNSAMDTIAKPLVFGVMFDLFGDFLRLESFAGSCSSSSLIMYM